MPCSLIKSLAPLFEPPLQVSKLEATQTRNFSDALGARAVAGNTGDNIGIWNSVLIYRPSHSRELLISVFGWFRS